MQSNHITSSNPTDDPARNFGQGDEHGATNGAGAVGADTQTNHGNGTAGVDAADERHSGKDPMAERMEELTSPDPQAQDADGKDAADAMGGDHNDPITGRGTVEHDER